jgi:hypothetical protein
MSLADEDTGVVDGLCKTESVHAGLETTFQEILNLEGQHVIESHAGFVEDTDTDKTANQGVTLEETLGIFLVASKKLTVPDLLVCQSISRGRRGQDLPSSTTDLGQGELDTPDLTLVAQAILADHLQLGVTVWDCGVRRLQSPRLKQRQATAHWPGNTNRRADS